MTSTGSQCSSQWPPGDTPPFHFVIKTCNLGVILHWVLFYGVWLVNYHRSNAVYMMAWRYISSNPYIPIDGPLSRYVKLRVAHAPGMSGTFSQPPRVSDPNMNRGTCLTHVPWCMPGALTGRFFGSRWRGKRSRHSRACATRNFTYLLRSPWHRRRSTHNANEST